jgi:hypothetical protein
LTSVFFTAEFFAVTELFVAAELFSVVGLFDEIFAAAFFTGFFLGAPPGSAGAGFDVALRTAIVNRPRD